MSVSVLEDRLGVLVALTEGERLFLRSLDEKRRTLQRGAELRHQGDKTDDMHLLIDGWAMSVLVFSDGRRLIQRLHFAGDPIGVPSIAYRESVDTIIAITPITVVSFGKDRLGQAFEHHPRIAALFFLLTQAERVALTDRLASIGRSSAKARVASLLLHIHDRTRQIDPTADNSFALPLTQEEIGDMTGLTAVHVNRMLRALSDEGLIARGNGRIEIVDTAAMEALAHHVNRFKGLDTSWLPAGR